MPSHHPASHPDLVLDALEEGVFTVDRNRSITSLNRAAERITGYTETDVLGRPCWEVFRTEICATACPLKESLDTRRRVRRREVYVRTKDDRAVPISVMAAPLLAPNGTLLGGVEAFRDLSPHQATDEKQLRTARHQLGRMVGRSPALRAVLDMAPRIAESDSTILIQGPSGVGKELLARTLHELGPRRAAPFVSLKCAGVPEPYLESSLFGCGPWVSGEEDSEPGGIARANGGTLFLDEVGDLPLVTQVKLLNMLECRTYEPVGASGPLRADVRTIAATRQDLGAKVREGSFREDLLFRLQVLPIELPPLARRREDIPLLTRYFITRFAASTGNPIEGITSRALDALLSYDFPGNVRELEVIVERAFILCRDREIDLPHLPPAVGRTHAASEPVQPVTQPRGGGLDAVERETIRRTLERYQGNRSRSARELGIHRSTLLRKMRRYHLR